MQSRAWKKKTKEKSLRCPSEQTPNVLIWWFPEIGVPQRIHFNRIFHYITSIFGILHLWKPPYSQSSLILPHASQSTLALLRPLRGGIGKQPWSITFHQRHAETVLHLKQKPLQKTEKRGLLLHGPHDQSMTYLKSHPSPRRPVIYLASSAPSSRPWTCEKL